MQKETPWLKLCEVPCHCSMYLLGTIIITIIMNSQFYCQNWDYSTSQRERERERERSQTWLTILVHATINDWERNSNECRNIRPQQKAKKNALRNFYKILDQNGKRWNPNCDREGGASSYIFIIIIITMDCESSENLWHEISEDRRFVRF
jgi:hypothetical protein